MILRAAFLQRMQGMVRQMLLGRVARLGQEELAEKAGVSWVTIVRTERGERSVSYGTSVALAKALGVFPDQRRG